MTWPSVREFWAAEPCVAGCRCINTSPTSPDDLPRPHEGRAFFRISHRLPRL
jgi:hypothetical protein